MKTRVHELLNVGEGEVAWFGNTAFYLANSGTPYYYEKSRSTMPLDMELFIEILNNLGTIIRRPALTDEQRETLVALNRLGFKHVAKNNAGWEVIAYTEMPNQTSFNWHKSNGSEYVTGTAVKKLGSLIPDWKTPLDIAATLREAGVGV